MNAESWSELELLERLISGRTLSAAARSLGVDQTTVSRRLAAFERRLGTRLFDRVEGGWCRHQNWRRFRGGCG